MVGGKESRMKVPAQPSAGARRAAGKTDSHEETLRKGRLPKAEAVRQARSEEGVAKRCIAAQVDDNARDVRKYSSDDNDKAV